MAVTERITYHVARQACCLPKLKMETFINGKIMS